MNCILSGSDSLVNSLRASIKWGPLQNEHDSLFGLSSFLFLSMSCLTSFTSVPKQFLRLRILLPLSVLSTSSFLFSSSLSASLEMTGLHAILASCLTNLQKTKKGGYMAALPWCGLESSLRSCSLFSHRSTSRLHRSIRCRGSFFAIL